MELGTLIKNGVIIGVILLTVFLSQQPNFAFVGKTALARGNEYFAKTSDWVKINAGSKVSGEASVITSTATQKITEQKNNFVQGVWDKFKNYFAEKFSNATGTKVK